MLLKKKENLSIIQTEFPFSLSAFASKLHLKVSSWRLNSCLALWGAIRCHFPQISTTSWVDMAFNLNSSSQVSSYYSSDLIEFNKMKYAGKGIFLERIQGQIHLEG